MTARVATDSMYRNSVYYMQRRNLELEKVNEQYNTGKKYQSAADSPSNFASTMRLEHDIAMYEQYTTNSGYALDNLTLEETSLSTINEVLDRANVLLQSGVNGSYSGTELNSISQELKEIQKQIYDLINTKTATGESIFSGGLSDIDAYLCQDDGTYVCQADCSQRFVQASSSAKIAVSDSAKNFFEHVETARSVDVTGGLTFSYSDYQSFESFYNRNYLTDTNPATETTKNTYTVTQIGTEYAVTDYSGNEVARSAAGAKNLNFNGLNLNLENVSGSATFTLATAENDNVLNTIGKAIAAIDNYNNGAITRSDADNILSQTQVSIRNTQLSVNTAMTSIGARQNTLDNIINANCEISDVKKEAKATISEVDLYEVTTDLTKTQTYLQMAMTSFNYVTGTSLFDYIH
ncbi:MAG: flagellar hook-associated protein FlgL [Succinivibrionaceae bacterium]|nr:flagellar hook-associated protein FlgL [Succinivibrionaceae bacterium]